MAACPDLVRRLGASEVKTLGKLVQFEKRRQAPRRAPEAGKGGDAKIVLFTGVRYERGTTLPDKPPAAAGPKRKRG